MQSPDHTMTGAEATVQRKAPGRIRRPRTSIHECGVGSGNQEDPEDENRGNESGDTSPGAAVCECKYGTESLH
jgi:hypothetical protein